MLSGNSESIVAEAAESALPLIDELLLIDTGITDGTYNILRSIAKEKLVRVKFEWCHDFAAARNFALLAAKERQATWAMTIDTDERFNFGAAFGKNELLQLLNSNDRALAWMLRDRNGTYSKERFIRLPTHLRWIGRTHEALGGFVGEQRFVLPIGYFWEPPKSAEGYRNKLIRDQEMLQEETRQRPRDPRWWYYLGQTQEGLKDFEQAIASYRTCIALDGWQVESATACFRAASCLRDIGRLREAEELSAIGLTRNPRSAELLWLASYCAYQLGAYSSSAAWAEMAVDCGEYLRPENRYQAPDEVGHLIFRYPPASYEAPFDVLRYAYRALGKNEEATIAEIHFQRAKSIREQQVAE